MPCNMAVIDELAGVRPMEIQTNRHRWIRIVRVAVPEWNLNRVEHLPLLVGERLAAVNFEIVLRKQQQVDLMDVEPMIFQPTRGAILDCIC